MHEYPLYFMPLADDLLSLELEDAFTDLYLVGGDDFPIAPRLTNCDSGKIQDAYSLLQRL